MKVREAVLKEQRHHHFVAQHRHKNGNLIQVEVVATYLDQQDGLVFYNVRTVMPEIM